MADSGMPNPQAVQMSKKTKQQNVTFVTEVFEQTGDFYNTYIHVVEETI